MNNTRCRWRAIGFASLPLVLLLLTACSSSPPVPKDVASAWRKYRHVKVGMTAKEIHVLIGLPSYHSLTGPYTETWTRPDPPSEVDFTAYLRVFYDGIAATSRSIQIDKGLGLVATNQDILTINGTP